MSTKIISLPRLSLSLLAPFALALSALTGAAEEKAPASPQARPAAKPAPKTVKLGYFANLTHAQAVLGVQSGVYGKALAPSKLETKVFNAGPSLIEALNAGEIDVAYVGPGPAINGWVKSKGRSLNIISGSAANGVVIVVSEKSGITKLEDLKGKRIATPQLGNTQDIAARWYVKNVLKQEDADNIVPIPNAEQLGLLQRGQIDAAWSPEPWATRLVKEAGAKVLTQEKDLWPNKEFSLTLVVTTQEFLRDHHDLLKSLLVEHAKLTTELQQHPQEHAAELAEGISKLTGKKVGADLIGDALKNVKFTVDPLAETLETQAKYAYDLGAFREPAKLKGLVDTSLLPQGAAAPAVPAKP